MKPGMHRKEGRKAKHLRGFNNLKIPDVDASLAKEFKQKYDRAKRLAMAKRAFGKDLLRKTI